MNWSLLFGRNWSPDRLDTYGEPLSGSYGILTMVVGTFAATLGAMIIGGMIGSFTAVFLVFWCPKRLRGPLGTVIDLLAVSLILGIMVLPTVVSLSRVVLEVVPRSYYEGSVALGATHAETVFRVMIPAARSGILASLVLGTGRAMGETMAVVMVAENAAAFPQGLFSSFRVLTANIVMEMGYAGEVQEGALIATGAVRQVNFSGRRDRYLRAGRPECPAPSGRDGIPEAEPVSDERI